MRIPVRIFGGVSGAAVAARGRTPAPTRDVDASDNPPAMQITTLVVSSPD